MRLTLFALTLAAAVTLTGCAVIPLKAATDQQSQEEDLATKSDLLNAKIGVIAFGIGQPGETPTLDGLADYGFTPTASTPDIALHYTAEQSFCLDGTSLGGTAFKATYADSATEGTCEEGTDY